VTAAHSPPHGDDDLFDVPVVAPNVPGQEIARSSRASVERAGTDEPAPKPRRARAPIPLSRKMLWFAVVALALGDMLLVAILFPSRSSVPLPPLVRARPASSKGASRPHATREPAPPAVADAPAATSESPQPIAEASSPAPTPSIAPVVEPPTNAIEPPTPVVEPPTTVAEPPVPAPPMSARERLHVVQLALDGGRRSFARVELGRILLDLDALPAAEREDTRAQAEMLVARALQDAADDARKVPR
jgi:hypothetical protein